LGIGFSENLKGAFRQVIYLIGPNAKPSLLSRILAPVLAIAALVAGFFFFTFVLVAFLVLALIAAIWWLLSGRKRFALFKQNFRERQFDPSASGASKREGQIIEGEVIRRDE
jgi:hypothetical protein